MVYRSAGDAVSNGDGDADLGIMSNADDRSARFNENWPEEVGLDAPLLVLLIDDAGRDRGTSKEFLSSLFIDMAADERGGVISNAPRLLSLLIEVAGRDGGTSLSLFPLLIYVV